MSDDTRSHLRKLEITDVDALFTLNGRIRVIVEIEESGIRANKLCGKLMSAALSDYHKRGKNKMLLDSSVLFVQVLMSNEKNDRISSAWSFLEGRFNELRFTEDRAIKYVIYWGNGDGLTGTSSISMEDRISSFLRREEDSNG